MKKLLTDRAKVLPVLVVAIVIAVGATLVIVLTTGPSATSSQSPVASTVVGKGKTAKVDISMFAYRPATLTIAPGTTVAWTNLDTTEHTATAANGTTFDTGPIQHGQTKTFTFTKPGTYHYKCNFHPFMTATVIVK